MQASETKLREIIQGDKQYIVPLFQRPYSWKKSQWEALWNDILELCSSVICLENGKLTDYGNVNIIKKYFEESLTFDTKINHNNSISTAFKAKAVFENILSKEWTNINEAPGDDTIRIRKIFVANESNPENNTFNTNDKISITVDYEKFDDENFFDIGLQISSMNSFFFCQTLASDLNIETFTNIGNYRAKVYFEPDFFNNTIITIGYSITRNNKYVVCHSYNLLYIKMNLFMTKNEKEYYSNIPMHPGPLRPKLRWEIICK